MLQLRRIHHVAIICSDLERSKDFDGNLPGLRVVAEHHRVERQSHQLDLAKPRSSARCSLSRGGQQAVADLVPGAAQQF